MSVLGSKQLCPWYAEPKCWSSTRLRIAPFCHCCSCPRPDRTVLWKFSAQQTSNPHRSRNPCRLGRCGFVASTSDNTLADELPRLGARTTCHCAMLRVTPNRVALSASVRLRQHRSPCAMTEVSPHWPQKLTVGNLPWWLQLSELCCASPCLFFWELLQLLSACGKTSQTLETIGSLKNVTQTVASEGEAPCTSTECKVKRLPHVTVFSPRTNKLQSRYQTTSFSTSGRPSRHFFVVAVKTSVGRSQQLEKKLVAEDQNSTIQRWRLP